MKTEPLIEILKSDFEKRRKRNKAYSLRSFSRDLKIDASNLSKLLSYQKSLGTKLKQKLASQIGFSESDYKAFSPDPGFDISNAGYKDHVLEVFETISKSYHYVILELFKISSFDGTPAAISNMLGLTRKEAKEALQRLLRVGLLETKSSGKLSPVDHSSSSILAQATSRSHREQQKEILEGAIDALEKTPVEKRSQTSMTMAVDSSKLAEAREVIQEFRRKMGRLMSQSENLDQVYQLSISLYPVLQTKKESES